MSQLKERIADVIDERQRQRPVVDDYMAKVDALDEALQTLEATLVEAADDAGLRAHLEPLVDEFRAASPLTRVEEMRQALSVIRGRFARDTINIGVSGQARVGKSTLLQSISGLGDEQIPTGSGLPVTAVRSWIEHSTRNVALVRFHDWFSFRTSVLGPYFGELGLGAPPSSPDAFASLDLSTDQSPDGFRQRDRNLLQDLQEMHTSFASYRDLITGREEEFPLGQIRELVRKPDAAHEQARPVRKYLAEIGRAHV